MQHFGATGVTTRRMGRPGPISGLRTDGEEFPLEASISQVEVGGQRLYTVILRDVTERVQADAREREHRETLAAVIEAASDAVVSTDAEGRITLFNPAAERIFGHTATDMLGQTLESLLPTRHRGGHMQHLHDFAESHVTRRAMGAGRVKGLHAGGEELELEASISQAVVNGRLTLTAILRDVTQRVHAETALLQYQVELSELAQRLMMQEKATTQKLAQVLHDQLGQTLTGIRLSFDAASAVAQTAGRARSPQADRISGLIDQAIREVRQVLVELRPTLLDDSGLAAALENELRVRAGAADGIAVRLDVAPALASLRWPPDVEYAAFMVAREAVANAIQHAVPSEVRVVLSGSARSLRLEVIDNGQAPLSPDALRVRPGHLGLVGMRERALAINARFEARPGDAGGTVVSLEWEAGA